MEFGQEDGERQGNCRVSITALKLNQLVQSGGSVLRCVAPEIKDSQVQVVEFFHLSVFILIALLPVHVSPLIAQQHSRVHSGTKRL